MTETQGERQPTPRPEKDVSSEPDQSHGQKITADPDVDPTLTQDMRGTSGKDDDAFPLTQSAAEETVTRREGE
jgi:hypothetical protein